MKILKGINWRPPLVTKGRDECDTLLVRSQEKVFARKER
jgi:hypothetical protein